MKHLILLFALTILPLSGFAQSGTTGNLTWSITNGTLTISGTGIMPDYLNDADHDNVPWRSHRANINKVIINNGVTSIGLYAFSDCSSLTSVSIPNSVTGIGIFAFYNCRNLTSVAIPNSVISIGNYAFYSCSSLTSVIIPNSVTSIGVQVFMYCTSLTSVSIPNSITGIGESMFYGCSGLTSVSIPNSITSIGRAAFFDSGLISISIPNSVTSIGRAAFQHCISLTSASIPNSVTSIGEYAFTDCISLTSVSIPSSVTSIGNNAFDGCRSLTSVTVQWTIPLIVSGNTFEYTNVSQCTLIVPAGTKALYQAAPVWKDFFVTTVGNESVSASPPLVYAANHTLYIELAQPDVITVYGISGQKLWERQIPAGAATVNADRFPQGVLIVKGSSGWVKKVVNL
ncbi:MAG: leucine-rich repeat domain-containing protein [Tannerellaceae bacterium]|jgi:hypothetical protein|nr:leucine-rich repeat domain-containing protein [Tannerellaceae bacterium]